jgi:hypothetical protein
MVAQVLETVTVSSKPRKMGQSNSAQGPNTDPSLEEVIEGMGLLTLEHTISALIFLIGEIAISVSSDRKRLNTHPDCEGTASLDELSCT